MYFFPPFPPFEKGGVKTYNLDQPFSPFESLAPPFKRWNLNSWKTWRHRDAANSRIICAVRTRNLYITLVSPRSSP